MQTISLVGAASFLPETIIDNEHFMNASGIKRHPMFRGTKLRRHIKDTESATTMATAAINSLKEKLNLNLVNDVDVLITNVTIPDIPFVGCGAAIVGALGLKPKTVYDLQNGGCVSFIFMMELAQMILNSTEAKSAIICNIQTAAGRICGQDDNLKLPQSAVPGDGCGAAYFVKGDRNPIHSIVTKTHGEYANDMKIVTSDGRDWWQPGTTAFNIDFGEEKISSVIARGNKLVPEVMYEALALADLQASNIDTLITNQPNRIFLRNWREAIQLDEDQHINTLPDHGNLFGAGIPISLTLGLDSGRIKPGTKILLSGFSHAGDYSAGAVLSWNG
ncbi:MAG: 3-oxoacyl-ACP synthase [Moraxellaceae bacterium]|nr:MAG: 3-oxoacyl-ACP synthase [Moraxellaceae bacterium]